MVKKSFKKNGHLFRGETNPFNIKVNRKKHNVVNSNVRGTKGLPGVSKSMSQSKRKELWHKSRLNIQKSNRYFDKRLLDSSMPLEDQVTARFVRERQKKGKKYLFNLNDEELTHKGQSVRDINEFDNNCSGSEEEDALGSTFVSKAHFGGFASESNFESSKSHKDFVEQLIMENKLKKHEVRIGKEKYINAQETIDQEWKEIHSASSNWMSNKSKSITKPLTNEKDIYDISKNELQFEPKSSSITHCKTLEEIAKEEEEKKIKLQQEKLSRMLDGETKDTKIDNHISADGIYDYFDYLEPTLVEQEEDEDSMEKHVESDSDESIGSQSSFKQSDQNIPGPVEQNMNREFSENDSIVKIPSTIENFRNLTKDCNMEQVYDVVDNILKPYIKSKKEKVITELGNFFGILLQYSLEGCESSEQAAFLLPHLHLLAEKVPCPTAEKFLEYLNQEQEIFTASKKQNKKLNFPSLQALMVLKFSSLIYSVSDFRHPIVTPAVNFMCNILSSKFFNSYSNLLSRLFVCGIMLDCIEHSKRFIPEAIHFLNYVLKLAADDCKKSKNATSATEKFNPYLREIYNSETIVKLNLLDSEKSNSEKTVSLVSTSIDQLHQFASLYSELPSYKEIFSSTLFLCSQLPVQCYPPPLQESVCSLMNVLQRKVSLRQLVFQNVKPKPLKLFEPSFESKYSKKDDLNKKRKLLKQVSQKIKKEEKCMMREIRRDAQVASSERLKEKLESDAERKRKVKEILSELAMQEGEYKKMMKK